MWAKALMLALCDIVKPPALTGTKEKDTRNHVEWQNGFSYLDSRDFREVASLAGFEPSAIADRIRPLANDRKAAARMAKDFYADRNHQKKGKIKDA
ncbi:hypothetical protein [Loktanella sp. 3ANDIMAR09]|uniref:hypothetical protein n=1 Tax=Loktanella sp. 3ANDIMAR09 TaxID=1225657 RepID=UPI0012ED672B|nr:hypothetical protein [Loktanella sp. 3ANDIMAR09]